MDRFWQKISKESNGCWNWAGARHSRKDPRNGYGVFRFDGKPMKAHRVSWLLLKGDIPNGLQVLHKCDNVQCVNPDHLFLGTQQDNIADMVAKGRNRDGSGIGRKLTAEQVKSIRSDWRPSRIIAKEYGVGKSMVNYIKSGDAWSSVG